MRHTAINLVFITREINFAMGISILTYYFFIYLTKLKVISGHQSLFMFGNPKLLIETEINISSQIL